MANDGKLRDFGAMARVEWRKMAKSRRSESGAMARTLVLALACLGVVDAAQISWIRMFPTDDADRRTMAATPWFDCDFQLENGEAARCGDRRAAGSVLCLGDASRVPAGVDFCSKYYVEAPRVHAYARSNNRSFETR